MEISIFDFISSFLTLTGIVGAVIVLACLIIGTITGTPWARRVAVTTLVVLLAIGLVVGTASIAFLSLITFG